jgi:hypothetical protein
MVLCSPEPLHSPSSRMSGWHRSPGQSFVSGAWFKRGVPCRCWAALQ